MATQVPNDFPEEGMRLNKYIAHCGVCSRREAAELVKKGQIKVNGAVEKAPAYLVQADDEVTLRGKTIRLEQRLVYIILNKSLNTITTTKDERDRKTVMHGIAEKFQERLFPVGRLDRMTTGLLLITNDGDLAKKMTHPSYEIKKVYHATLDQPISDADLDKIKAGLVLHDGPAPVDELHRVKGSKGKEVSIGLHIGRNRIVRRIFAHLGYEVVKLDRTFLGGLTKKDLPRGRWRHLRREEIIMVKHLNSGRKNG